MSFAQKKKATKTRGGGKKKRSTASAAATMDPFANMKFDTPSSALPAPTTATTTMTTTAETSPLKKQSETAVALTLNYWTIFVQNFRGITIPLVLCADTAGVEDILKLVACYETNGRKPHHFSLRFSGRMLSATDPQNDGRKLTLKDLNLWDGCTVYSILRSGGRGYAPSDLVSEIWVDWNVNYFPLLDAVCRFPKEISALINGYAALKECIFPLLCGDCKGSGLVPCYHLSLPTDDLVRQMKDTYPSRGEHASKGCVLCYRHSIGGLMVCVHCNDGSVVSFDRFDDRSRSSTDSDTQNNAAEGDAVQYPSFISNDVIELAARRPKPRGLPGEYGFKLSKLPLISLPLIVPLPAASSSVTGWGSDLSITIRLTGAQDHGKRALILKSLNTQTVRFVKAPSTTHSPMMAAVTWNEKDKTKKVQTPQDEAVFTLSSSRLQSGGLFDTNSDGTSNLLAVYLNPNPDTEYGRGWGPPNVTDGSYKPLKPPFHRWMWDFFAATYPSVIKPTHETYIGVGPTHAGVFTIEFVPKVLT